MFFVPSPIDLHLAKKLRAMRTQCGVTQYELGELIGVTFQQIQKYESALNKISASRLYEICRVLNRPLSSFFENMAVDEDYYNFEFVSENEVMQEDQERNKEVANLIKAFNQIKDEEVRKNVINLVDSIVKSKTKK